MGKLRKGIMSHDLNIKTHYSSGAESPEVVWRTLRDMGDRVVSFTDAFSLNHNRRVSAPVAPNVRYLNGTEWFTRLGGRGFGRVDLLFVNFALTDGLDAWADRELALMHHKWKKTIPTGMALSQSWQNKYEFARLVQVRNLKRAYFDTLPSTEVVMRRFLDSGGRVFLSDMPFTTGFSVKCRMVKQLRDMGLSGIVVFKDETKYLDAAAEIQQSLDLCKYSDLLPVVGSGITHNYRARAVVYREAQGAFDYMTNQLLRLFAAPARPLLGK